MAALLVTFVVSGVAISGDSMEPTLHGGERALVPRFETWLHRIGIGSFGRGEIVYFPSPDQEPGAVCPWFCTHLIKRIVAVGGDTLAIVHGQLHINGVPAQEPYLGDSWNGSFSMPETPIPPGHVFVLGDNRGPYGSFDSRVFGPVPESRIEGRAAWVVWPLFRRTDDGSWHWNVRRLEATERRAPIRSPAAPRADRPAPGRRLEPASPQARTERVPTAPRPTPRRPG
jgi:signal peptidase I